MKNDFVAKSLSDLTLTRSSVSLKMQLGISSMGLLCLLVIAGTIFMLGLKIAPLYTNNNSINASFVSASSSNFNDMTRGEIRTSIQKSFSVNGIRDIDLSDIEITQNDSETTLLYTHEDRVNILSNIDVVIRFENYFTTEEQ